MNFDDKRTEDINIVQSLEEFLKTAEAGFSSREEILQKMDEADNAIEALDDDLGGVQAGLNAYESLDHTLSKSEEHEFEKKWGVQSELRERFHQLGEEREKLADIQNRLTAQLGNHKNFDKNIFFTNIRNLLKEKSDVKIGQIEKEAGVRLGYTARLEKPENPAEPSIEYIVTAAKLLGVSLDSILKIRLDEMTPTEQYLVKFLEKLKADTLKDKLDWRKETPDSLSHMGIDYSTGEVGHPLLDVAPFAVENETGYPEDVAQTVFVSNTFGHQTSIHDTCYNLRMKNGSILYLMDIEKNVHKTSDPTAYAKEVWMYVPGTGSQFLCGTKAGSVLEPAVTALFETVVDRAKHPNIRKELKTVMDAFMRDDMDDDITNEGVPFD